jgi:regulator of cell morphogenesis and NO signaling
MEDIKSMKVSKIVARNYKTAKVFTEYGIDFCCNGGIPLEDACEQKKIDVNELMAKLETELRKPDEEDYQSMEMNDLVDHIVKVHHTYVNTTIPVLTAYLEKLSRVHGERHPELHEIRALFQEGAGALIDHMKKEEFILFPFIKAMNSAEKNDFPLSAPHFGNISHPISMMESEHEAEGDRFRTISKLSDEYTCPPDGCQTYRVAYAVLDEFEKDLHKHIHLENNILFPKATEAYHSMYVS